MIEGRHSVPPDHPVRQLFRQLTTRGMEQMDLRDFETSIYLTNLLTDFVDADRVYAGIENSGQRVVCLVDMLTHAGAEMSPAVRRDCYRHIGDVTLFMLGIYPESLDRPRRAISGNYYLQQGRRSYSIAAEIDHARQTSTVYRKLSDRFEQCVMGLNWVRTYMSDPFYQYMFREFGII